MSILKRIRSRCEREGGCLIWQGGMAGTHKSPQISVDNKKRYVRQLMWELTKGPVPEGCGIGVNCGTVGCVHPDHLVARTRQERGQKAADEGKYSGVVRAAKIAASKRRQHSTLTPEQVHDIRYGEGTKEEAAARHGVSKWTARAIRLGLRWKEYNSNPFAGLMR